MNASLATVAYIGATILFILSLGGLSNQETARRGNLYGMVGMSLAVLATVFGPQVTAEGIPMIVGAMLVGMLESFGSFWASAFKEVIVFTVIIPVLPTSRPTCRSSRHADAIT
jgi:NAD/NADP transhydrogenase beta subunit